MAHLTALEQQREDQALGAAWRRCEAALPEGWTFSGLIAGIRSGWIARASAPWRYERHAGRHEELEGVDPTPTAALEALADALEARAAE